MSATSVEATIAGRTFTLACGPDERADLEEALALVGERVDEAYAQSANSNSERLLLLAALNLAHDLRRVRSGREESAPVIDTSTKAALTSLQRKIEAALG